jgi:hypothetical protein
VNPFRGLFDDPAGTATLAELDPRVLRRAQRMHRGGQSNGAHADMAEIRARAAEQAQLARAIGEAIEARNIVRPQALIREGAALYGHGALLAAVEAQANQDQQDRMAEPYHRVDDAWADNPEPHYPDEEGWLEDEPR